MTTRFRVNTPPVIHELLDGEVIVVNLDTGTYYSIPGTGAEIWTLVDQGASLDETVAALLERHDVDGRRWSSRRSGRSSTSSCARS